MSLEDKYKNLLNQCVNSLSTWKELIDEHLNDDEKPEEIEKLKKVAKDYCQSDQEFRRTSRAVAGVVEYFNSDDVDLTKDMIDVDKLYASNLKNIPISNGSHTEHEIWSKVFGYEDVEEVVRERSLIDEAQFERIDDSVSCSNVFKPPIDPMSKTIIMDPYRNQKCNHVYENLLIFAYIRKMKNRAKCPYIGCCNVSLKASELVEDTELKQTIQEYLQNHPESDEGDD